MTYTENRDSIFEGTILAKTISLVSYGEKVFRCTSFHVVFEIATGFPINDGTQHMRAKKECFFSPMLRLHTFGDAALCMNNNI